MPASIPLDYARSIAKPQRVPRVVMAKPAMAGVVIPRRVTLPAPTVKTGGGVSYVVGDSIADGAAPKFGVRHRTKVGIPTATGVSWLAAARPSGNVVVSLGANDDPGNTTQFRSQIRRALRAAPGARLIWATVPGAQYAGFNRVLRQEAARSGGRLVVANTGSVRTSDGTHPVNYSSWAQAMRRYL